MINKKMEAFKTLYDQIRLNSHQWLPWKRSVTVKENPLVIFGYAGDVRHPPKYAIVFSNDPIVSAAGTVLSAKMPETLNDVGGFSKFYKWYGFHGIDQIRAAGRQHYMFIKLSKYKLVHAPPDFIELQLWI